MKKASILALLLSSSLSYSQDTIFIAPNGTEINGKNLNDFEKKKTTKKIMRNNKPESIIYSNFSIKEKPQSSYQGFYQNGQPYNGYFVNKIIFREIPLVDYYEKGQLKYQYSFDFLKQLDNDQHYEYDVKSVFENGKITEGFEFYESDNGVFLRTRYKNKIPNYLELNLFAMHAFNRYTFELLNHELTIKDYEQQISIKLVQDKNKIIVQILDQNGNVVVNNQQRNVEKETPNSITIFKIVKNKLTEEYFSLEDIIPIHQMIYEETNPLFASIYLSVVYNREIKITELFQQLEQVLKSNHIEQFIDQESFLKGPDKILSNLRYDENGKPYWGIKITEKDNHFLIEFYEDGKITSTKNVNSLQKVEDTINSHLS